MTNATDSTVKPVIFSTWSWVAPSETEVQQETPARETPQKKFAPLRPIREWFDNLEVKDAQLAHHLCYLIPAQCPFERDVKLFGRTLFHIPPLCKLNPLYEELTLLRFRALCYLADECGEDISAYC
jgi:Mo-dependent nitrogenase C-terminus